MLLQPEAHLRATAQAIAPHGQTRKKGRGAATETTAATIDAMTAVKNDRAARPVDLLGPLAAPDLDEMHREAVLIDATTATGETPAGDRGATQSLQ